MTNTNDSLKSLAVDGALVTTSIAIGAISVAMNEYAVASGLVAVAALNAVSIYKTIRRLKSTRAAAPVITEDTVRMLIARETAALRGLTSGLSTVQGFIETEPTAPVAASTIVSKPATYDVGNGGYVTFKAKSAQSATGSDLMDLEEELRGLDTSSGKTLVLTEFRSKPKNEGANLVSQIERGGRLGELVCHGIFENVDVIPHLGTDPWKKAREINEFLSSVKGVYSRVVVWLPEEEYFAWTGVIDHFGSATTRLFNESVR